MDNVTHGLIGAALGYAASEIRRKPIAQQVARAAIWTAVIASNVPDLDFLVTPFLDDRKLGYLLHHRGHTHTLLLAAPLGALSAWAGARISGIKLRESPWILALGVFAGLLHVGTDIWNDYGVHPFWPFDNRWFYGDFVFIIEPLIWMALLPFGYFRVKRRWPKAIFAFLGLGMLGMTWFGPFTSWQTAAAVTFSGIAMAMIQKHRTSARSALVALAAVLAMMGASALAVREEMKAHFGQAHPDEALLDLVTTPAPANPSCWRVIQISEASGEYRARVGAYSFWPEVFDPARCFVRMQGAGGSGPLTRIGERVQSGLYWEGEFRASIQEFRALASERCRFSALLRFARVPYFMKQDGEWIAGDLRYHSPGEYGFTDLKIDESDCKVRVPPWTPPRADLLE